MDGGEELAFNILGHGFKMRMEQANFIACPSDKGNALTSEDSAGSHEAAISWFHERIIY